AHGEHVGRRIPGELSRGRLAAVGGGRGEVEGRRDAVVALRHVGGRALVVVEGRHRPRRALAGEVWARAGVLVPTVAVDDGRSHVRRGRVEDSREDVVDAALAGIVKGVVLPLATAADV